MRLAEERNELLDDAVIYLESLDDALSEGGLLGGGGGGFGGIITELAGAGAETAGDVAVEAGDTVAETIQDTLVGTVSTALGTAVSDAISNSEVAVADEPVPVTPNPLPVEGGGGGGTTVSPTIKPTVDVAPDVEFPDLEFGSPGTVRVDSSQLPLSVVRDPLPVENVGPIPVEDVGPITVSVETRRPGPSDGGSGGSDPTGGVQIGGENGITLGPGGIQVGGDSGVTFGRDPGDPTGTQSGPTATSPAPTPAHEVAVTHSPTYRVDVDPRRLDGLADRIISEIEDGIERDIDALESDLNELERNLDELEREIRQ